MAVTTGGAATAARRDVATVVRHDFHGHDALVALRLADGTQVTARMLDSTPALAVGNRVTLSVRGHARAFPAS